MTKDTIVPTKYFDCQIRRTSILKYVYELNNVMTFMFFKKQIYFFCSPFEHPKNLVSIIRHYKLWQYCMTPFE